VSLTVAYGALLTGVIVWLLLVRKLSARSWEGGVVADDAHQGLTSGPAKMGLLVFLAVITSLFGLFISAYYLRMGHGHGADAALNDWEPLIEPPVLWLNTALLILGSIAMQWTRACIGRGDLARARTGLIAGGGLTLAFLIGQFIAWREIRVESFFTPQNPAIAFFYLLTAVHGLHLLGGLYVWARTLLRMQHKDTEAIDVYTSVELCTVYWHYLLFVWLVLFAMLLST
jgi:cytochrome c oxidase subunit III